ncbi:hypothetical protein HY639_03790, partial [Candidatus Woesearchaeota archaeon]|nr:hypothetical protein [Candidatus Woesearchaeota archaeon]
RPTIEVYVVHMLKDLIKHCSDPHYSEERLDGLWAKYDSAEFAETAGLDQNQGKKIICATRQTILDDIFTEPVTLCCDDGGYTFKRTDDGLYVRRDEK